MPLLIEDASGLPVAVSAANPLPIGGAVERSSSSTVAQVASSATVVTLIAANAARGHLVIFNDSTQVLTFKLGSGASTSSLTYKIPAGGQWAMPPGKVYTGIVTGLWVSANGFAYLTEY